jgi:hypothetical protein
MMCGPEKSDSVVVAGKPTNKAERFAAELAEPRTGTKGNADQLSTCRTQSRISVTQGVGSHTAALWRQYPRWEKLWGGAAEVVAPSSSIRTDGGCPWCKPTISAEA